MYVGKEISTLTLKIFPKMHNAMRVDLIVEKIVSQ
jgi:hypothetical protein